MESKHKVHRKRKPVKKDEDGFPAPRLEALAELTSSEVVDQVKAGLSRIAPLDEEEFRDPDA